MELKKSHQEKVVMITGASSGIGRSIALCLGKLGYKLTLMARSKDKLNKIVDSLECPSENILILIIDLRDEAEIHKAFFKSYEHWGRLDVLINNAGVGIPTSFYSGPIRGWKEMWEVNVLAMCICIKEALSYFSAKKEGYIINISSTSAHRVSKNGEFYAATKFAVRALSESLRQEIIRKKSLVRVSCISPGRTATSIFQDAETFVVENKAKEILDPEDIANTVIYLLDLKHHVSVQDIIIRSRQQVD